MNVAKCPDLQSHLETMMQLQEYKEELVVCEKLLEDQSNEKEAEFEAKNKVLQEYKMIDEDQNILFKGKVAKEVTSADAVLLTQLVFSGHIKNLTDEELLALLSCVLANVRPAKSHAMLEAEISESFWSACLHLEQETGNLIAVEAQSGVTDEEKDPIRRLNYFFYELIHRWAKKESFVSIKSSYPNMEEGILVRAVYDVKKICATVAKMAIVIGDNTLAARVRTAAELLNREIMSTQSLYFE
jgi:superfamily II RNA helicase